MKRILATALFGFQLLLSSHEATAGSVCIVNNTTHAVDVRSKGMEPVKIPAMTSQLVTSKARVQVVAEECARTVFGCSIGQNKTLVIHPSRAPSKEKGVARCSNG